jgi:hypothetical protein
MKNSEEYYIKPPDVSPDAFRCNLEVGLMKSSTDSRVFVEKKRI